MNNYLIHYNLRAKIKYKQGYVTKGSYRLLGKVKKKTIIKITSIIIYTIQWKRLMDREGKMHISNK